MSLRTFLALDVDAETRGQLARAAEALYVPNAKIRGVPEQNLHITLNFLGDVADEMLPEICDLVTEVASGADPFDFEVERLIVMPPRGRPRMVWASMSDPSGAMTALQGNLTDALEGLGFCMERRKFKPHITLARVKYIRSGADLHRAVEQTPQKQYASQHADEVTVYTSTLTPDGSIYTPMARCPIGE